MVHVTIFFGGDLQPESHGISKVGGLSLAA